MGKNGESEILTVRQSADLLQTSRQMIYTLIERGDIKAYRLGRKAWRIARSQILRFCEEGHDKNNRR